MGKDILDLDSDKITDEICDELFLAVEKDLDKEFKKVIDNWYKEYEPSKYMRSGNMYNAYRVKDLDIEFEDPDIFPHSPNYRINDQSYIYEIAFVDGWHGGANFGGALRYPYQKGAPDYDGDDNRPYLNGRKISWSNAVKGSSPQEGIRNALERYMKSDGLNRKIARITNDVVGRYL